MNTLTLAMTIAPVVGWGRPLYCEGMNLFDFTSEGGGRRAMVSSLIFLHIVLVVLVVSVYIGRQSDIIFKMFNVTLNAIIWNLAVLAGDKGIARLVDAYTKIKGGTVTP